MFESQTKAGLFHILYSLDKAFFRIEMLGRKDGRKKPRNVMSKFTTIQEVLFVSEK